jgi:DNA invertase Pin-like site-specific DNA recombinase
MKVLYVRVSSRTFDQNTDRQKTNEKEFDLLIEDKCSGAIPFFQREGGKKILTLLKKEWLSPYLATRLIDVVVTYWIFYP